MRVMLRREREMGYNGLQRETGEAFDLAGMRNDELLLKHRYLAEVPVGTEERKCDMCSKWFVDDTAYNRHLSGRQHPESPNYDGPEARTHGEAPTPREEILAAESGPPGRRVQPKIH